MTTFKKNSFFKKRILYFWGSILVVFLLLNSCGKNLDPTFIPTDANLVLALDFNNLSSKAAGWQEILNYAFDKSQSSKTDIIDLLTHSGINLGKNAYIFGKITPETSQNYFALSLELNDEKQFMSSLRKNTPNRPVTQEGEMNFMIQDKLLIGWNKQRALILSQDLSAEALKNRFREIFSTGGSQSLEQNNTEFYHLLNKKFDMALWMDFGQMSDLRSKAMDNLWGGNSDVLQELSRLTESTSATIHFENGKIVSNFSTHTNEALWNKFKNIFREDGINQSLLKNIPIKSPTLLLALGVGTQGIREIMEEAQLLNDMKKFSRVFNTSPEKVFDLFTGDMVVAFDEIHLKEDLNPYYEVIMGIGIKNRPDFDKLLDQIDGFFIKKKGDYYLLKNNNQTYYMIEQDNFMYFCNTGSLRDKLLKGSVQLDKKLVQSVEDHSSLFSIDFNRIGSVISPKLLEGIGYSSISQVWLPALESLEVYAAPYSKGVSEGKLEINLKDKSRNALVILLELIKKTSESQKSV
ncbi:MAG: DUF4836 family protein [Microscillaceae bacterium]|nr:DUF4836 family protein [Microscillaceae bacterium]